MGVRIGPVRHRANERPASLGHGTGHLATELLQELGAALVPGEARAGVPGGVEGEGRQALEKGGPLVAHATAELHRHRDEGVSKRVVARRSINPALGCRSSTSHSQTRCGRLANVRGTQGVSEGEVEEDGPRAMVAVDDEVGAVRVACWSRPQVCLEARLPGIPHRLVCWIVVAAPGGIV